MLFGAGFRGFVAFGSVRFETGVPTVSRFDSVSFVLVDTGPQPSGCTLIRVRLDKHAS